jgi:aminomethyltransferase
MYERMLVSISASEYSRMESVNSSVITELRKTPLNALHRRLRAKMVNFGGWDMPVEYPSTGGLVAEHKAVRNSVGVFDVSHMGDIRVHGRAASQAARDSQPCSTSA